MKFIIKFFRSKLNITIFSLVVLTILFACLATISGFFVVLSMVSMAGFCIVLAFKFILPKKEDYSEFFEEEKYEVKQSKFSNFIDKSSKRSRLISGICLIILGVIILWFIIREIFNF